MCDLTNLEYSLSCPISHKLLKHKKRNNIAHCVLHKKNKSETRPGQLFPILYCLPKKRTNVY